MRELRDPDRPVPAPSDVLGTPCVLQDDGTGRVSGPAYTDVSLAALTTHMTLTSRFARREPSSWTTTTVTIGSGL